jgi:superfamily I DNA and/or RNA helicase
MAYAETLTTNSPDKTAYIISTYRRQNQLVRRVIEHVAMVCPEIWRGLVVTANTVDSCQGHEADLVVLTLVRERQTPFMRSSNRMNVAFTRAKSKMVVVGPLPAKTREGSVYAEDRTLLDHLHDYEHLVRSQCAGSTRLERAVQLTKEALAQR